MIRPILFLFPLLLATPPIAQSQTFKKSYGGSGDEQALWFEILPDGSFIVCGRTTTESNGGWDALVVKFDPDGSVLWANTIGGGQDDSFHMIKSSSDGGFIATGSTTNGSDADLFAVKLDGGGNIQWQQRFGSNSTSEEGRGVNELADGFLFTGYSGVGNSLNGYFVKTNPDGNLVWAKTSGTGIAAESLLAGGEIRVAAGVNGDGTVIRLDNNGNVPGTLRLSGAGNEALYYIKNAGGGFIVSDHSWVPSGNTEFWPWLVKLNNSGGVEWSKCYDTGGFGRAVAETTGDGGFVFGVHSVTMPQAIMVKTDASGNLDWAKSHSYPSGASGNLRQMKEAPDGGFVAIGYCTVSGNGTDLIAFKTDAVGNIEDCCPVEISIGVVTYNPTQTTPGLSLANLNTNNSTGFSTENIAFTETDRCLGPSCCPTDAGTMLPQTLHACINQPATLIHNGDEVLDNDDLLQFILFSDPNDTLGSIIATSNTPTFTFNPATMQTGVTYYVAAIAGNNVGGNVDFNDPCFDLPNNAAELIWHPLPEVVLQTDNSDVCSGDCRTLTAVLTGTPPFALTVTSPAGTTTVTIQGNTGTFQVCPPPGTPPGSFTVQATMLTDAWCTCP